MTFRLHDSRVHDISINKKVKAQEETRIRWASIGKSPDGRDINVKSLTKLDGVRIPKGYYNYRIVFEFQN